MKTTFIFYVYFFLVGFILISAQLHAQPGTAQFETTLHFTDAVGNKDSVVIGCDLYATHYMDTIFGESAIENPFDSVFEVRVGGTDWPYRHIMSKKFISPCYRSEINDTCITGTEIFIYVWSKYPPFTVSWDTAVFKEDNECLNRAFFNMNSDDWITPYYVPNSTICLAMQQSASFDMTPAGLAAVYDGQNGSPGSYPQTVAVQGYAQQMIYPLRYSPFEYSTLCHPVALEEVAKGSFSISPNPATAQVQLQFGEAVPQARVRVYTLEGRQVAVASGHALMPPHTIDVGHLPKGMYWVQVYTDVGLYATQKLVVQ